MNLTDLLLHSNLPIRELSENEATKLKKTLLEMFKDISNVCEKENLTVFLGGGSCLGAVRHKGFIPWDDDLDLNMLRKDYDKFPVALEKYFPGKYFLRGPGVSEDYSLPFIKIERLGTLLKTVYEFENEKPAIGIDLFPLENIPDNKVSRFIFGLRNNLLQYISVCVKLYCRRECPVTKLLCSTKEGKNALKPRFLIGKFFSYRSYKNWYKKCDKLAQKYKNKTTKDITCPTGRGHFFGEILHVENIFPPAECSFEGESAKIYGNYNTYLSNLYGDYMEVPPPEKREKHFIIEIDFGK